MAAEKRVLKYSDFIGTGPDGLIIERDVNLFPGSKLHLLRER